MAWRCPQPADQNFVNGMKETCEKDLQLLLTALPERFCPIIQKSLASIPAIFTLPMVLLQKYFSYCNIMVDSSSNHLVGVIDWAEAEIGPFGSNLYSLQSLMGKFHLKNGWIRYNDYDSLEKLFWDTLRTEVGLSEEQIITAKAAAVVGLLRSWGFTSRLANMTEAVPIKDDESGAYNMLCLDGLLVNSDTKIPR